MIPFDPNEMMLYAYYLAQQSPDDSTQCSAVLLKNNEPIAAGLNCVPYQLGKNTDFLGPENRENKYLHTVHAEVNAICACANKGIPTNGLIMFAPWACCTNCAKTIIAAGIKELWTHQISNYELKNHSIWSDEVEKGLTLIRKSGIHLHLMDGKLDPNNEIWVRRNYELVSP